MNNLTTTTNTTKVGEYKSLESEAVVLDREQISYIKQCFEYSTRGTCHFDIPLTEPEMKEVSTYMDMFHAPWFFCCGNEGIMSRHAKFEHQES